VPPVELGVDPRHLVIGPFARVIDAEVGSDVVRLMHEEPEWENRLMPYLRSPEGKALGPGGAIAAGLISAQELEDLFGFDGKT
jgi:hypothetical protein